ncbi:RNF122 [Symbiodinium natans]|uniref:RNF122 protein n=1 Tax=Symbiodinium natans TaxID=878477 RepID=A0A812T2Z8_9DINO|nr:RNF122 [Symbiodinium natans]
MAMDMIVIRLGAAPTLKEACCLCSFTIFLTAGLVYTLLPSKSLPLKVLVIVMFLTALVFISRTSIHVRNRYVEEVHAQDLQEHVWAPAVYGSMETTAPRFHRVLVWTCVDDAGASEVTIRVLEEVDLLYRPCLSETCVFCLEDFAAQDEVTLLPCGHAFHQHCHAVWHALKRCSFSCPLCRDTCPTV